MNAEALIGKVLGSCALQELIGQGGMGAVYLAQQSRPRRQVAVKVLMPLTPLAPHQLAAFLERFRRETDAAASLEHPNIVPVHEYGEQEGIAYLVMPYIAGGTLRDEMEHERQMSLAKAVNYLEQLASALDFAHERGVIHRDIKPANILLTPTGRLLLTDFGLVKVAAAEQAPTVHLTGVGMPMGTPDYMAPEQVTGDRVDGRADLYALGAILYQMVTGTTPFHGETPMQIAVQHLQTPPPSPRSLRSDLPVAAEQVILRALAKRPVDRYERAQDLANAFRIALASANVLLGHSQSGLLPSQDAPAITTRPFTRRGLFDPAWQAQAGLPVGGQGANSPAIGMSSDLLPSSGLLNGYARTGAKPDERGPVSPVPPVAGSGSAVAREASTPLPETHIGNIPTTPSDGRASGPGNIPGVPATPGISSASPESPPTSRGSSSGPPSSPGRSSLGMRMNLRRFVEGVDGAETTAAPPAADTPAQPEPVNTIPADNAATPGIPSAVTPTGESWLSPPGNITRALPVAPVTGVLPVASGEPGGAGNGNTMRLTAAVKVVQVPVAGQPGRYMTGLLPVVPEMKPGEGLALPGSLGDGEQRKTDEQSLPVWKRFNTLNRPAKIVAALVAIVLVVSTSLLWLVHVRSGQSTLQTAKPTAAPPNFAATAAVQATATADANIILSDPLNQNIHNWPISTTGSKLYSFKDGAYHITDNNPNQGAPALLADMPPSAMQGSMAYSMTMEEIKGDDSTVNNAFGLIFRFTTSKKGGKIVTTFYTFEVTNTKGGQYQFWKYNDAWGTSVSPWTKIWSHGFGKEFHQGHGAGKANTFKVFMHGSNFTFEVNGKQVGTSRENSISSGQVGMLVNWKGTEVAFTDLLLTYS